MLNQSYSLKESRVLWQIRQGIQVYDSTHCQLGMVKHIRTSTELAEEEGNIGERTLAHIPIDIRRRLLREGFIQVDGGLVSRDYYIAPTQVCEVQDEHIILNVAKAEVMRF